MTFTAHQSNRVYGLLNLKFIRRNFFYLLRRFSSGNFVGESVQYIEYNPVYGRIGVFCCTAGALNFLQCKASTRILTGITTRLEWLIAVWQSSVANLRHLSRHLDILDTAALDDLSSESSEKILLWVQSLSDSNYKLKSILKAHWNSLPFSAFPFSRSHDTAGVFWWTVSWRHIRHS